MEKIVVTGSCGFIGYKFIKSNSSNFKIIGIDSLNNAYDNRLKELRLSSLNEEPNFTFKLLNLSDANTLDKESEIFENVSTVLHLGARAGVRQSFLDPTSYILDNTAATAKLALNVKKLNRSKQDIEKGFDIMEQLGITKTDKENIFDMIEMGENEYE